MTHPKTVHVPLDAARWPKQREWVQLDDLCDGVFDCPHSTPVLTSTGPFVVRSQDVRTGVFRSEEAAHVSEETYQERIARAEPVHGDILYSREGTYFGNAAEVPENTRVCLGQRMVLIRPKKGVLNSRFLRLWLNSPVLSLHIHGFRDGTVAERLNMPTIRALPVPLFSLKEQEAIASMLGAFDDKIGLNRQINNTMEAISRATFNDWFIDFGPTHAKSEGRSAYLSPELWSVFPAAFDEHNYPVGWSEKPLSTVIDLIGGGTPKTSVAEYWNGSIPWFSVVDAPDPSDVFVLDTEKSITTAGLENSSARILPVGTTIITARGTVGKLAMVGAEMAMNQSCYGIAGKAGWPYSYIYFLLKTTVQGLQSKTHGSVFDTITRQTFDAVAACCPTPGVAQAFEQSVGSLLARIKINLHESATLTQTRDLLLPRLISGQIQLKDAEGLL